jgi:hypothetical protein
MPKKEKINSILVEEAAHLKARDIAMDVFKIERPSVELINAIRDAVVEMDGYEPDNEEIEELMEEYLDAKPAIEEICKAVFKVNDPPHELRLRVFAFAAMDDDAFNDDDELMPAVTISKLQVALQFAQRIYLDESPAAVFTAFERAFDEE